MARYLTSELCLNHRQPRREAPLRPCVCCIISCSDDMESVAAKNRTYPVCSQSYVRSNKHHKKLKKRQKTCGRLSSCALVQGQRLLTWLPRRFVRSRYDLCALRTVAFYCGTSHPFPLRRSVAKLFAVPSSFQERVTVGESTPTSARLRVDYAYIEGSYTCRET